MNNRNNNIYNNVKGNGNHRKQEDYEINNIYRQEREKEND